MNYLRIRARRWIDVFTAAASFRQALLLKAPRKMLSRGFPNRLRSFFSRAPRKLSAGRFAAGIVTTASFLCLIFIKFRAIVGLKAANDAARNRRPILDGTTTLLPLCFPKLQGFFVVANRQITWLNGCLNLSLRREMTCGYDDSLVRHSIYPASEWCMYKCSPVVNNTCFRYRQNIFCWFYWHIESIAS